MQTVFSTVLPDVPQAAGIWLALLAVAATAVAGLIVRPDRFRSVFGDRISEAAMPSSVELAEEARERARYAQEVGVAAERAATTAERRRAEWLTAEEEVEEAWLAYQAAEEDVRRLAAAAALPLPRTARTPAEYVDRERWLHRAALDAQWRGEITVRQLSDILGHRGWDPRRHPVEQELLLRRLVRDNLLARHEAAREREQAAWRAAELAAAAARSLREEAYTATGPAPEAQSLLSTMDLAGPAAETSRGAATARGGNDGTRETTSVARGRAAVPAY
ncbi:hypothetical protein DLJ46_15370 [Micromonospora globispora]|uniref:AP2/ERF domain-containing protein n=2 Tax=Micromonospora globispora TaxID=1450148 RepID=A0A317K2U6_9ACTN|nr:hypothetical protein [Micromonospora globispora]PWU47265.1 hypothetical protein DLJ46_15370 [Micromonospora globispora]RQW94886.1 hypothetical protein DKL51_15400 [Micromonospora globispora]